MESIINPESRAARAITAMAHSAGTSEIYINTLSRIINAVLFNQDDMGMDDTEAIETIRTLSLLRADIRDIADDKALADLIAHGYSAPEYIARARGTGRLMHDCRSYTIGNSALLSNLTDCMELEGYPSDQIEEIKAAIVQLDNVTATLLHCIESTPEHNYAEGGDQ